LKVLDEAKKQHKLTLIANFNAMRKSASGARGKEAELNAVEQQLQDKLLQLSRRHRRLLSAQYWA